MGSPTVKMPSNVVCKTTHNSKVPFDFSRCHLVDGILKFLYNKTTSSLETVKGSQWFWLECSYQHYRHTSYTYTNTYTHTPKYTNISRKFSDFIIFYAASSHFYCKDGQTFPQRQRLFMSSRRTTLLWSPLDNNIWISQHVHRVTLRWGEEIYVDKFHFSMSIIGSSMIQHCK